jgi:hypothetical protein
MAMEMERSKFKHIYTCISTEDYWTTERDAHFRAKDRLAYSKGKRVPYTVKMSIYGSDIDRSKEWLEDNFKPVMVQADVIVFESLEQKKAFMKEGLVVYVKY